VSGFVTARLRLTSIDHYADIGITRSIFSLAARRNKLREDWGADRRTGELKMCWTEPLHDSSGYGY
jgi:hypothetical protein